MRVREKERGEKRYIKWHMHHYGRIVMITKYETNMKKMAWMLKKYLQLEEKSVQLNVNKSKLIRFTG